MCIFAFLCNRGQETVSIPKYMYIVLSIENKTQLILESEPTLSEKVGGAGCLFLSSFFWERGRLYEENSLSPELW